MYAELQQQLNVMDKKLMQKNEEMNILLNYKVSNKNVLSNNIVLYYIVVSLVNKITISNISSLYLEASGTCNTLKCCFSLLLR